MIAALALLATLAAAASSAPASATSDTTETRVILVRHADKNTDWVGDDPPLSIGGHERAHALAHALSDLHVDVIYSTHFLRARATAESVAVHTRDSVEVVDQAHPEALAARVWSEDRGRTVLIVGHSDTVPAIIHALCPSAPVDLGTLSYDRLFIVTRRGNEAPHLIQLRYGAP